MNMRTPLSRVRGHGSAKEGAGHWIAQRATALALIPLVIFVLFSVVHLTGASYEEVRAYYARPIPAAAMLLFVLASIWHLRLGLQVVIEDYIAKESTRIILLVLVNGLAYLAGALSVLSILRIYVTG